MYSLLSVQTSNAASNLSTNTQALKPQYITAEYKIPIAVTIFHWSEAYLCGDGGGGGWGGLLSIISKWLLLIRCELFVRIPEYHNNIFGFYIYYCT